MIGLEKCCITSAYLQWLCHSGERTVARGPLVFKKNDGDIVNAPLHPSVPPSIQPSYYLFLNHCAEFNQTFYITSPHSMGV